MRERNVDAAVALERQLVEGALRREAAESVVDVLVQQRDADLRVVDQIDGVFLPHPQSEVAAADRQMTAGFEHRIALGPQIELRHGSLQRQIEELRRRRIDVFERERREEASEVGIGARP